MRHKIVSLLVLLVSGFCHAGILYSGKIDTSVNNLATTYTLSGASNISLTNAGAAGQFCWSNQTGNPIAFYLDNDLSTVTPTANVQDLYVPGNTDGYQCLPTVARISRSIQVRSDSGSTINGGLVYWYVTDRKG